MGVQGLLTLLKEEKVVRDVLFGNSRLVVDGGNLLNKLYFASGLDQNHGGDYGAFEALIERMVAALRLCAIAPYVVLDGCDVTEGKQDTQQLRSQDRIQRANRAAVEGVREGILPRLARLVFKQTLARLGVPLVQCYAGADQEVASLASEWRCPVLSDDSDFFIFQLPAGLLLISDFRWEELEQEGGGFFVPCKSYRTEYFCSAFKLRPQLLPTFAALGGNDYVKLQSTKASAVWWNQFDLPTKSNRLRGLLSWLKPFQEPRKAFEAALGLKRNLSLPEKAELLRKLAKGAEQYQLRPSTLKSYFDSGTAPPYPAEQESAQVPDWMRLALTQGRLIPQFLNVLQRRRMYQSIVVEAADRPSSSLTSRPLRQMMYGLLLGGGNGLEVEEVGREGLREVATMVSPTVVEQLVLQSPDQETESTRLRLLLEALQVTEASLAALPPELRLPVAVTCLWVQRAEPAVDDALLEALLHGMSSGSGTTAAPMPPEGGAGTERAQPDVLQACNQWQACLEDGVSLNQLLGCPLPEPTVARLYEGTLVHQRELRVRPTELFQSMLAVVQDYRPREDPQGPSP